MLSILIPIYNFNVIQTVDEIYNQAKNCKIDYEIILIDDASEEKFRQINSKSDNLTEVRYIQLEENIGRSKIRNLLASEAKYDYLLFMDSDSLTTDKYFLSKYLKHTDKDKVIYGGTAYQKEKPYCKDQVLRWVYGTKREVKSAEIREKDPYKSFISNNFVIPKSVFQKVKFDESLSGYGHEDTLFGMELFKQKIKVKHINNPLIHKELDHFTLFLDKTRSGISNLIKISSGAHKAELREHIKLLRTAQKFNNYKVLINFIFFLIKPIIFRNLRSSKPKLILFDLFKLWYYFARTKNYD